MKISNLAFLSDGWWIEEDTAWFLYSDAVALFKYNFKNGNCEYVSSFQTDRCCTSRQYVKCIKNEDEIILLPDFGDSILFYSIKNNSWMKVGINASNNVRLACWKYIKKGDFLYILSEGLKKIIELDILQKKVANYYDLLSGSDDFIGSSAMVSDTFYIISSVYSQIYTFNCLSKETKVYRLPEGIDDNLRTISCHNGNAWMTGRKKKVYRWNMESGELDSYEKFPSDFGIYDFNNKYNSILECGIERCEVPLFIESVLIGTDIWFIPFQTNKILYFNIETNELKEFKLTEEEENAYSVKNRVLNHKYLLLYVKENRYIGLYSLKNEHMIEIDAETITYRVLPFIMGEACMEAFSNKLFLENRKADTFIYSSYLKGSRYSKGEDMGYVGSQIYQMISSET